MLVKDRMTSNPVTAHPDTTHRQAAELLRENDIHHLPIVDKRGKLVGIIVEDDLFLAQPSPATTLSIYEIHSLLSKLELKQIMRHPVHTVNPECSLEEAAALMVKHDIGCLPVMDGDTVVGIITDTDIFESFIKMLGEAEEGARFTIRLIDKPGMLAKVAQGIADAGGNIISVTTWHNKGEADSYVTIKERGANFAQLRQVLDELDAEVVDVRQKPACQAGEYD